MSVPTQRVRVCAAPPFQRASPPPAEQLRGSVRVARPHRRAGALPRRGLERGAALLWLVRVVCLCLGASAARLWSERRPSRSHHRGHTQSGVWGQP